MNPPELPPDIAAMPDIGQLINNHQDVRALQKAVANAPRDLNILSMTLARVITTGSWVHYFDPGAGRIFDFRYEEGNKRDRAAKLNSFITFKPVDGGLGTDLKTLQRLLADYPQALGILNEQATAPPGGPNNLNPQHGPDGTFQPSQPDASVNGSIRTIDGRSRPSVQRGTTAAYAHRKLAKDRPDLFERVKAGELTAHRAMVEAGFRKVPTVLEQIRRLLSKLTPEEREAIRRDLEDWPPHRLTLPVIPANPGVPA